MKKVLILTVIAILALGVMALADHATCDHNLFLSGKVNITVAQWTEGSFDANTFDICDYGSHDYSLGTLTVKSNGKYRVFVDISDISNSAFGANVITALKWMINNTGITGASPTTLTAGATAVKESNGNTETNTAALIGYGFKPTSGWFSPDETTGRSGELTATFNIPRDTTDTNDLNSGSYNFTVNIWVITYANKTDLTF